MQETPKEPIKVSYLGRVRHAAFDLWEGSTSAYAEKETEVLGGIRVLHLALRTETPPTDGAPSTQMIEARSAYGSLYADDAPMGILRAVAWDKRSVPAQAPESPIKIPAQFVPMSVDQVRQWIVAFDGIPTVVRAFSHDEPQGATICLLRVESDGRSSVFEQGWQVIAGKNHALETVWRQVWQAMGEQLQMGQGLTAVREYFPHVEPEAEPYDFTAYRVSPPLP